MTASALQRMIDCQDALMKAIDARDIEGIEAATSQLSNVVHAVRQEQEVDRDHLAHALKQTTAIKIRVNTLADWTRQRIDLLSELRGASGPKVYSKFRNSGVS